MPENYSNPQHAPCGQRNNYSTSTGYSSFTDSYMDLPESAYKLEELDFVALDFFDSDPQPNLKLSSFDTTDLEHWFEENIQFGRLIVN
jgi:hypothetical protein